MEISSLKNRFKGLTKVEDLDSLKEGDAVLMDSIGVVYFTGIVGNNEMEFANKQSLGYILAFRGNRQDAVLRGGTVLDFQEVKAKIYSPVTNSQDYQRCNAYINQDKEAIAN